MDQQVITLITAAVTASSALFAVLITQHFNLKAIQKRIDFESSENEKKRKLEIRKEIYLGLVEDIHYVNNYLFTSIGEKELRQDRSAFNKFNANINKLLIISSNEIGAEVDKISSTYSMVLLQLQVGLKEIVSLEYLNEELEKIIIKQQAEFDALNNVLNEIKITEMEPAQKIMKFGSLVQDIEIKADLMSHNRDEVIKNIDKINQMKKELFSRVIDEVKPLRMHVVKLMNLLRADLDITDQLEFDSEKHEEQFQKFKSHTMSAIEKVID